MYPVKFASCPVKLFVSGVKKMYPVKILATGII
jgi:hypothetical protein